MVAISKLAALGGALLNTTAPVMKSPAPGQEGTASPTTWKTICGSGVCAFQPLYPCKWNQPDCYVFDHVHPDASIMGERSEELNICKPEHIRCYRLQPHHVKIPTHSVAEKSDDLETSTDDRNTKLHTEAEGIAGSGQTHGGHEDLEPRVSRDEWFGCHGQLCLTPSMCCGEAGCHAPPYGCPAGYNITGPPSMMDWVYTPPEDKGYHCDWQGMCYKDKPEDKPEGGN